MKFMRVKEVANKTGLAISTVKLYEDAGNFPMSLKTSPKVRVWLEDDIEKWMQDHLDKRVK